MSASHAKAILDRMEELSFEIEVRDEALMACLRDADAVRELIERERQNLLDSRSASS